MNAMAIPGTLLSWPRAALPSMLSVLATMCCSVPAIGCRCTWAAPSAPWACWWHWRRGHGAACPGLTGAALVLGLGTGAVNPASRNAGLCSWHPESSSIAGLRSLCGFPAGHHRRGVTGHGPGGHRGCGPRQAGCMRLAALLCWRCPGCPRAGAPRRLVTPVQALWRLTQAT